MSGPSQSVAVPSLNLRAQYQAIRDEIEPVVLRLFESQMFVMGPEVEALEAELADYCGSGPRNRLCVRDRRSHLAADGAWHRAG